MFRSKRLLVLPGLVVVACLGAGLAYATIPSGDTITGCYKKSGGALN